MTDLELLTLAAKAAGIKIIRSRMHEFTCKDMLIVGPDGYSMGWNPLNDDGDALRLAIKCNIEIHPDNECGCVTTVFMVSRYGYNTYEDYGPMRDRSQDDPMKATRHAVVCAAARIGEDMK